MSTSAGQEAQVIVTDATHSVAQSKESAFVDLRTAKGRPMLTWVGKQTLERVPVLPAQCMETFEPLGHRSDTQSAVNYPFRH